MAKVVMENGTQELDPDARATLRQIQIGMKRIESRNEVIKNKQEELAELKPSVQLYDEMSTDLKELKKLNESDKDFIKKSIEFYEAVTGEAIGAGPLFESVSAGTRPDGDENV